MSDPLTIAALVARIEHLKLALGDNAGWFDRAMAAERARDAMLDRLVSPEVLHAAKLGVQAEERQDSNAIAFAALSAARAFLLKP